MSKFNIIYAALPSGASVFATALAAIGIEANVYEFSFGIGLGLTGSMMYRLAAKQEDRKELRVMALSFVFFIFIAAIGQPHVTWYNINTAPPTIIIAIVGAASSGLVDLTRWLGSQAKPILEIIITKKTGGDKK